MSTENMLKDDILSMIHVSENKYILIQEYPEKLQCIHDLENGVIKLRELSDEYKNDKEVVLVALEYESGALQYASERLKVI